MYMCTHTCAHVRLLRAYVCPSRGCVTALIILIRALRARTFARAAGAHENTQTLEPCWSSVDGQWRTGHACATHIVGYRPPVRNYFWQATVACPIAGPILDDIATGRCDVTNGTNRAAGVVKKFGNAAGDHMSTLASVGNGGRRRNAERDLHRRLRWSHGLASYELVVPIKGPRSHTIRWWIPCARTLLPAVRAHVCAMHPDCIGSPRIGYVYANSWVNVDAVSASCA